MLQQVLDARNVRAFMQDVVWLELESMLRAKKRILQAELNDPATTPERTQYLKGVINQIQDDLRLPSALLDAVEEQESQEFKEIREV